MELQLLKQHGLYDTKRSREDLTNLLECIDALPSYVGATDWGADPKPIVAMANFIMKYFPQFGVDDLIKAFEMSAAGLLKDDDGKVVRVTTYGKPMNIDVVGSVLSAYRTVRNDQIVVTPPERRLAEPEPVKMTNEEHYVALIEYVGKHGKVPDFYPFRLIHAHLVSVGHLEPIVETVYKRRRELIHDPVQMKTLSDVMKSDNHRRQVVDHLIQEKILTKNNK